MHVNTHMHMHMHVHEYTHMYMYTHSHMYIIIHVRTHTASADYRFSNGSFSFPPSTRPSQEECYNIYILDDATYEATEQLSVNLSTSVSRVNLITTSLQIEIEDNDNVTVGLNQTEFAVVEELQSGDVSFTVCTVLTGSIEKTVIVRLFSEHVSSEGKPLILI